MTARVDDLERLCLVAVAQGETLLHYAVRGRRPYIIQYCLDEGADINKKNRLVSRSRLHLI